MAQLKARVAELERLAESLAARPGQPEAPAGPQLAGVEAHMPLDALFDRAPIGIALLDRELRYVRVNGFLAAINGQSVEAHLGRPVGDILRGYDRIAEHACRRVLATGEPVENVPIHHGSPSDPADTHDWLVSYYPSHGPGGAIVGVAVVVIETTERLRGEAALRASEERLRQLVEGATVEETLRASEERYRTISEMTSDYVYALRVGPGRRLSHEWVTAAFTAVTGYTPTELEAAGGWALLMVPEDSQVIARRAARLFAGEDDVSEFRIRTRSGQLRWVRDYARAICGPDGQVVQIIGAVRDITVQHEAQEALRLSEARYRSVVTSLSSGIVLQSADGSIQTCNASAERILGLSADQMMGRTSVDPRWRAIREDGSPFPGEEHPAMVALQTGRSQDNVIMGVQKPGGELTWISINARPVAVPGLQPAVVASFTDITERRALEADLRFQKTLLECQSEASPDGIVVVSPLGACLYANERFLHMWRLPHAGLATASFDAALPMIAAQLVDPEGFSGWVARVVAEHRLVCQEQLRLADGRVMECYTAPVLSGEGMYYGRVWYFRDVTVRAQAEEQILAARAAAEAAARSQAAFLAVMSHEIRTPMNGVIGMTGLLLDTELTQEQREYAETVRRSGEALLTIINDILDFSKIEAGRLQLESVEFDVRQVADDVAELLAESAERKGLLLGCLIARDVPRRLRGDPGRLRQVLTNLVANAIKFTERGEVIVRAYLAGRKAGGVTLAVSVEDTGIGIPLDVQARLFQPFTQADASTTRRYGGTGLGLAICRQLVTLMGGEIRVASAPGAGSTFSFTVQLGAVEEGEPLPARLELLGARVLIVDDVPTSRSLLGGLTTAWGMRPTAITAGEGPISTLRAAAAAGAPFEVAVINIVSPGPHGFALVRAIKDDPAAGGTPVILVTSYRLRGSTREARQHGAHSVLTRPIRESQLYNAILAALADAPHSVEARPPAHEGRGGQEQDRTGRILVVEDNAVNQRVAVMLLEKLGYRADVAANGQEALDALAQTPYQLVLMDCHTPLMDGFAATAAIRAAEGGSRRTPIVALTANALPDERERCLAAGMDDYLAKPVSREALQGALARWMPREPEAGRPEGPVEQAPS